MNMRFFLASRINNPESLAKLENFLGAKFATKTVAYIPTASNGEKAYGDWKDSDALAMARKNFKSVHIVELEDCWERNLLPEFDNVDIVKLLCEYEEDISEIFFFKSVQFGHFKNIEYWF